METSDHIGNKKTIFQSSLLNYWQLKGRSELPWRKTDDPWKILIAEVLLRKTTSLQAVKVFEAISTISPEQLINIDEDELIEKLTPLGLYRVRAKQLKRVAQKVVSAGLYNLSNPDFLISLPGVGKYIRNAVLCFGYRIPKPALDTNMIRVIKRVFSYRIERSRAREDKKLWEFAETIVPKEFCREYNWAVLDLGAAVCTPRNPKCSICPLVSICDFAASGPKPK